MSSLQRLRIDKPLFLALATLGVLSLFVIYSASTTSTELVIGQGVRLAIGLVVMVMIAQIPPETLIRWSPVLFAAGTLLLVLVLGVGAVGKGAQRWLNLGLFRFQPSEIMKLAEPMILAWYFSKRPMPPKLRHVAVATVLLLVPAYLIYKQPDLGTAVMIVGSGVFVIFLSGLNWGVILALLGSVVAALPFIWTHMHSYQRERVLTLFDPQLDPLGAGYHTIQSMIAVGSGGVFGKGWLNSTQAHLAYLPAATTDFIYAVFAQEFGLIGSLVLFSLYLFIIARGLLIAIYAQEMATRLLAGGLILTFFLYFFINVGMVSGILPVVGVPLPLLSYGGSSLITLLAGFGVLMSIQTHRKIVQF